MNNSQELAKTEDRVARWIKQANFSSETKVEFLAGDASDRRFARVIPPKSRTSILEDISNYPRNVTAWLNESIVNLSSHKVIFRRI